MGEPLRTPPDDREAEARARSRQEAEAAVAEVMEREGVKAQRRSEVEARRRGRVRDLRRPLLLLALCAFNAYVWLGDPPWLRFDGPPMPTYDYYVKGWEMAVAIQAERIETYRASKGVAPESPLEAGPPVRGVTYQRLGASDYALAAGSGRARVRYDSSADSLRRPSVRQLLSRTAGPAGKAR